MAPDQAYRWLMSACAPSAGDGFDQHVFASILSLAIGQMAERQVSLAVTSGLDSVALAEIGAQLFPDAAPALAAMAQGATPIVEIEEQSIREILLMYASTPLPLSRPLAQLLARRCNEPHHLWQDLGLRNRGELSTLMERHFARLRTRNQNDMKWKKFLFRMVTTFRRRLLSKKITRRTERFRRRLVANFLIDLQKKACVPIGRNAGFFKRVENLLDAEFGGAAVGGDAEALVHCSRARENFGFDLREGGFDEIDLFLIQWNATGHHHGVGNGREYGATVRMILYFDQFEGFKLLVEQNRQADNFKLASVRGGLD